MTVAPGAWAERSACMNTPLEWWFPTNHTGAALDDHVPPQAAERCSTCIVRAACHTHAVRHEGDGVWAGTSPVERRRLRRALGISLDDGVPTPAAQRQEQP